jgi:hypothetical protein
VSAEDFASDLAINTTSAFVAAKEAVASFDKLSAGDKGKVFLYTGNCLNTRILPGLATLGVGKSATAYLIEDASQAYAEKGYGYAH